MKLWRTTLLALIIKMTAMHGLACGTNNTDNVLLLPGYELDLNTTYDFVMFSPRFKEMIIGEVYDLNVIEVKIVDVDGGSTYSYVPCFRGCNNTAEAVAKALSVPEENRGTVNGNRTVRGGRELTGLTKNPQSRCNVKITSGCKTISTNYEWFSKIEADGKSSTFDYNPSIYIIFSSSIKAFYYCSETTTSAVKRASVTFDDLHSDWQLKKSHDSSSQIGFSSSHSIKCR